MSVRRQDFWNLWQLKLRESLARLVGFIMRHVVCDASVARLMSLTIFSPGLLRIPVVCLMPHASVITMSQEHSLSNFPYLEP